MSELEQFQHLPTAHFPSVQPAPAISPPGLSVRVSGETTPELTQIPRQTPLLHVVLYQPEIPQNTGNIGRTCVAVGAKLWMVRPLGFRLDDRYLKRAGMDYWQHLDWEAVDDWNEIERKLAGHTFWLFTKHGTQAPWSAEYHRGDVLVFGSESSGLPERLRLAHESHGLRFPMHDEVRSLNLASTVNAAVYECVRQFGGLSASP